jgi:hypothetical protein
LLAFALVPPFGAMGGAAGFFISETVLLVLASRACASARFPVPVVKPILVGVAAALPMGAAVAAAGGGLLASLALGLVTYALTLAVAWRFAPDIAA